MGVWGRANNPVPHSNPDRRPADRGPTRGGAEASGCWTEGHPQPLPGADREASSLDVLARWP